MARPLAVVTSASRPSLHQGGPGSADDTVECVGEGVTGVRGGAADPLRAGDDDTAHAAGAGPRKCPRGGDRTASRWGSIRRDEHANAGARPGKASLHRSVTFLFCSSFPAWEGERHGHGTCGAQAVWLARSRPERRSPPTVHASTDDSALAENSPEELRVKGRFSGRSNRERRPATPILLTGRTTLQAGARRAGSASP